MTRKLNKLWVRVRLKGKTRGRPSKIETEASKLFSYWINKQQDRLHKEILSMILFGDGLTNVKWKKRLTTKEGGKV